MSRVVAVLLSLLFLLTNIALAQQDAGSLNTSKNDIWAPFRPLVGTWTGQRDGLGGKAKQTVEWQFVLGDRFLRGQTRTIEGSDPHADMGMISYDKSRKRFIYRAFLSEGFVNRYVGTVSEDGRRIEFVSESVENGPPGLRVKEVMTLKDGVLKQECLLASGHKPFKSCIVAIMEKDN